MDLLFGGNKVPKQFQLRSLKMWLHRGGSTLGCDGKRCVVTHGGYTCCSVDVSTCKRTQNNTAWLSGYEWMCAPTPEEKSYKVLIYLIFF